MSTVKVDGKGELGFYIGQEGKNILAPLDAVLNLFAISNVQMIGPTFDMMIMDGSGAILNPMPADGMRLQLVIGDAKSEPQKLDFRCVGSPVAVSTPQGSAVRISATLNRPKLYHSVCQKAVRGTSSSAIKQIAEECGLFVGDNVDSSVSDEMVWLPTGRKYSYFLANIASHGWFGDESAASKVAVTLDGEVRYKDLAKLARRPPVKEFYYGVEIPEGKKGLAYTVHDMMLEDLSTTGISLQGYTVKRTRFGIDGTLESFDVTKVTQNNESLDVSERMRKEVGMGSVILGAPDCGNTHKFFEQAEYQNSRYRPTFSRRVSVATLEQTEGVDLYDPVLLHYLDIKTGEPLARSGIISAKVLALVNGFYVERFNIDYQGEDAEIITG